VPLALLCAALVASGCGTSTARDSASEPTDGAITESTTAVAPTAGDLSAGDLTSPTSAPSTGATGTTAGETPALPAPGDRVAAYRYLVHDVTGFVTAAIDAEQQTPDVSPDDPAEVIELVGYDLADGVELVAWESSGICFTGPGDTWWAFGEARQVFLRLSLGTGECAGPTPDVVVDIGPGEDFSHLRTHVRAGADIAAQLPELDDFVDLMNDELADTDTTDLASPVEEGPVTTPTN
jgi:hypothetical protein